MGYFRHHAIVVTSYGDRARVAREYAATLFPESQVSLVSGEAINGYQSFAVFPDGSKEGWPESEAGDRQRDAFVRWLRSQAYADGSSPYKWAEVQFGDDDGVTKVVRDGDEYKRNDK